MTAAVFVVCPGCGHEKRLHYALGHTGCRHRGRRVMADLHTSLMTAVGKAALARHRESCSLCAADRPCVVANTHLCPPDRLHAPSTEGGAR